MFSLSLRHPPGSQALLLERPLVLVLSSHPSPNSLNLVSQSISRGQISSEPTEAEGTEGEMAEKDGVGCKSQKRRNNCPIR